MLRQRVRAYYFTMKFDLEGDAKFEKVACVYRSLSKEKDFF